MTSMARVRLRAQAHVAMSGPSRPDVHPRQAMKRPMRGDVYAFPLDSIRKYGACQVVSVAASSVVIAALDWLGDAPPADLSDVAGRARMRTDAYGCPDREIVLEAPLPVPRDHLYVGNHPAAGWADECIPGAWKFAGQIESELRWGGLPAQTRVGFIEALTEAPPVVCPDLTCSRKGGALRLPAYATGHFRDDGDYRLSGAFRMESLRDWAVLRSIALRTWRDDLVPFLEAAPLVEHLVLGECDEVLDLSRTHIRTLSVEASRARRILLPSSLEALDIRREEGLACLHVHAADEGAGVALTLAHASMSIRGLGRVRSLDIHRIAHASMAVVYEHHPGVRQMTLRGAPGVLREVGMLGAFPDLRSLSLQNVYGFPAVDLPGPKDMPALESLQLDSVAGELAVRACHVCRGASGVDLSIGRVRSPAWFQANIGNPFQHLDGCNDVPQGIMTALNAGWKKANNAIDRAEKRSSALGAVSDFVALVQELDEEIGFLRAADRDVFVRAIDALTQRAGAI